MSNGRFLAIFFLYYDADTFGMNQVAHIFLCDHTWSWHRCQWCCYWLFMCY